MIEEKKISVHDPDAPDKLWLVSVALRAETSFYVQAKTREVADLRAQEAMPEVKGDVDQWFDPQSGIEAPRVYHLPVADDELPALDPGDNVWDGERWHSMQTYQESSQ